jgi:hypothetical protein
MTDHSEFLEQFTVLNSTTTDVDAPVLIEEWAVFNDPDFLGPRFERGEIHPALREKLLEEPLFMAAIPGSAKRFMLWTNEQRRLGGKLALEGEAILRTRTITQPPFRTVTGEELDAIDEGRRPNG